MSNSREVWITGIGIVSSLGEGLEAHWQALNADHSTAVIDDKTFAPYPIHPICDLDFSKQIPKRGDLRQMEDWQRIGVYAAGLALDMAGIKGDEQLLAKTHIIAAAGNGERDPEADKTVLEAIKGDPDWREKLNDLLLANLRPTLYLAQQTQLLAGNISIVHKVTGGSRTFKGEEIAGVQIIQNAVDRIRSGQGELFLVGAANNAARPDLLQIRDLNGLSNKPLGSMGAFLVIESADHAKSRGAKPYAVVDWVKILKRPSSCGLVPQLMCFLLQNELGTGIEADFPFHLALGALAVSKGKGLRHYAEDMDGAPLNMPINDLIVTDFYAAIGEGRARLEKVEA